MLPTSLRLSVSLAVTEKCSVTECLYWFAAIGMRRLAKPRWQSTVRSSFTDANARRWPRNAQRAAFATFTRTVTAPPLLFTMLGEAIISLIVGFGVAAAAVAVLNTPRPMIIRTPAASRFTRAMVPGFRRTAMGRSLSLS